jgi:FMN phosphatase YigB (HAD superfamily)
VKPEPEIFEVAARLLDLDPAATTLVDDRLANLEQAARHGWSTVRFIGVEQVRRELTAAGWLSPAG